MSTDPRHLLGGYATGNLSPEERRALFAAALDDPDLFAALADEEAFKDLLSDPEATARIRAALAPAVRPFWRRPVLLGSAAGLLFVASTTALLWRDRPASPAAPVPKALPSPLTETVPQAPPAPAPPAVAPVAPKRISKAAPPPQAEAPAPVAALEDASRAFRVAPPEASQKIRADASKALPNDLALQVERFAAAEARGIAPVPGPRLIHLPEGRFRLEAPSPGPRHAYLLRRRGTAVEVLAARSVPDTGWLYFEGQLAPGDRLDFYLLESPSAAPATLPAEGPVAGQRIRIYPSSP